MEILYLVRLDEALRIFGTRKMIAKTVGLATIHTKVFEYAGVDYLDERVTLILNQRTGSHTMRLTLLATNASRWSGSNGRTISQMKRRNAGKERLASLHRVVVRDVRNGLDEMKIGYRYVVPATNGKGTSGIVISLDSGEVIDYTTESAKTMAQADRMVREILSACRKAS